MDDDYVYDIIKVITQIGVLLTKTWQSSLVTMHADANKNCASFQFAKEIISISMIDLLATLVQCKLLLHKLFRTRDCFWAKIMFAK